MICYVDDFSITVASLSSRGNIRNLQELFSTIVKRGRDIGMSFSVPKTELIHWLTPSQRTPCSTAPIELEGHLFHPSRVVSWLGYWFTPALTSRQHFRHKLSLAQAFFCFVKHLSCPGAGVQRWTTNNFFPTPTCILSHEAYLPAIISYCRYRRRLAALSMACAPPDTNPTSARLPQSFPSLSAFRAQDSSRHLTKGLSSVYLPLDWWTEIPSPPLRKHLPIDPLAHLTPPLQAGLTRLPLV